jgi:hypothetical protein
MKCSLEWGKEEKRRKGNSDICQRETGLVKESVRKIGHKKGTSSE